MRVCKIDCSCSQERIMLLCTNGESLYIATICVSTVQELLIVEMNP